VAVLLALAAAALDRAAKSFLIASPTYELTVAPGLLSFELVANSAGPLGLPLPAAAAATLTLGVVAVGALAARAPGARRLLIWLVVLGAASNTYDRVTFGYVVDTLRFRRGLAFNFADVYITVALAALIGLELARRSHPPAPAAASSPP
jgi:lipoprotein signal peptidase